MLYCVFISINQLFDMFQPINCNIRTVYLWNFFLWLQFLMHHAQDVISISGVCLCLRIICVIRRVCVCEINTTHTKLHPPIHARTFRYTFIGFGSVYFGQTNAIPNLVFICLYKYLLSWRAYRTANSMLAAKCARAIFSLSQLRDHSCIDKNRVKTQTQCSCSKKNFEWAHCSSVQHLSRTYLIHRVRHLHLYTLTEIFDAYFWYLMWLYST